jgi:hypothetical protein
MGCRANKNLGLELFGNWAQKLDLVFLALMLANILLAFQLPPI